jgi:deoxyribodipyrimidine photo-lyase
MISNARVKDLNKEPECPGSYVLYWMQQSQREACNHALETAIEHANRLGLPVLVGFGLTADYPDANARHYTFLLEGLRDVRAALIERGIAFELRLGSPDTVALELARDAAIVICDRGYLRHQKKWRHNVAERAARRVIEVEADVLVPVELTSRKAEVAARTIRPKILKLRNDFLVPLRKARVEVRTERIAENRSADLSDIPWLLNELAVDQSVKAVSRLRGGTKEAQQRVAAFITEQLDDYAEARREPAAEHVSFLSAYLHFGQISPLEIALAVAKADSADNDRRAYLDELIIRRELAINFVEYQADYDSFACIPAWAKDTLQHHRSDHRPYVYTEDQLVQAETHDAYWNAAMLEMRSTGYMHNHMRMYWGKKILEWSADPEQAFKTALTLNNRYFLCGRDANSYANVAWCFGLHDRPWPERPIFGKVRSMTASGLERKVDIDAYVRRVDELCSAERSGSKGR